ncbi:MAG TPA: YceI family protein [Patescibacteria group bacterium]|nr:YceI family protein [Patescibacteria group bacterium]
MKAFGGIAFVIFAVSASPALAAGWHVDPSQSQLGFLATQGGEPFQGKFGKLTADIDFDPAKPTAGHVLVRIDMSSATTGDRQRDEALPQVEWFDVKEFPEARFEANGFRAAGSGTFEALGQLTLRGVTKPLVLPFTFQQSGETARAQGQVAFERGDFGVGQGIWASGQWVGTTVTVTFDLTAKPLP